MLQTAVSELRQALQVQRAQVFIADELADRPIMTDDASKDDASEDDASKDGASKQITKDDAPPENAE